MSAIRTEDLRKSYGQIRALDGLTLSVKPGAIFGFLGPNGAGKTTTIRLLTGLARPSGGRAWVAGRDIVSNGTLAQHIGYLPEDPTFYGWMTPAEYVDHVGRLFGLPAQVRAARVRDLLALVGLAAVAKRRIGGFSRGMRQRLGLAQALVNEPDVLFLDEPVSALDPAGRKEVLELIGGLRGRCTVFMSSHILQDVERVCDTVGIINHGRLIVEAPQAELLARFSSPAFEVEVLDNSEGALGAWVESLSAPWLSSASVRGTLARLLVKDVQAAHSALLPLVAKAGLAVRRYEVVTPSLEDVFLRLVHEEDRPA